MIRIDARTVELSDIEMYAEDVHSDMLDAGYSTPDAVRIVRAMVPGLSEGFLAYLGE